VAPYKRWIRRLYFVYLFLKWRDIIVSGLGIEAKYLLFYIHGSVNRESNLITAQQDVNYSV